MARLFISDVEAEMYSLLDQLAELNGCSLEDELCEVLHWASNDAEVQEDEPVSAVGDKGVRLLINRKAIELKTS